MSGRPVSREQLRKIRDHRVKLCQSALLKDGNTACYFSGIMEQGESGDEYAVSLGNNGHAVVCGITLDKKILFGKRQKHTTLLHLLCQSRWQLLLFLLKRFQKKNRSVSNGLFHSSSDERFDVVAQFLMNNFNDLAYVRDDEGKTPLDRLIQYFGDSDGCLHRWQDVFKPLVEVGDGDEEGSGSHFIKSVLQKICQINLLPRKCGDSCACVKSLFQTLWYINRASVEKHSFQCAATSGNFAIMHLLLRVESLHSVPSFVTTEIWSTETGFLEPILIFLIKLTSKQRKERESDVLKIIESLVRRSDVDINRPDSDGLNAIFYSALYKQRKIFYFLIQHPTYKANWRNDRNESLEDLVLWSDIGTSTPAALIAIRLAARKVGVATTPPVTLNSSCSELNARLEYPELYRDDLRDVDMDQDIFKKKILDNFPRLCDDMEPDGKCLDILIQKGVFPWSKIDGLMNEKNAAQQSKESSYFGFTLWSEGSSSITGGPETVRSGSSRVPLVLGALSVLPEYTCK